MLPAELESYLHEHIPLSGVMAVSVASLSRDQVTLTAPLGPNINHRATVFGGSASAVATLAAWSLLHLRLRESGLESQLVIQRSSMEYERPIHGDFQASAEITDSKAWLRFQKTLERHGRARLTVEAVLTYDDEVAGRLSGDFVAIAI